MKRESVAVEARRRKTLLQDKVLMWRYGGLRSYQMIVRGEIK